MSIEKHGGNWQVYDSTRIFQGELAIDHEKHTIFLELRIMTSNNTESAQAPYIGKVAYVCGTLYSGKRIVLYDCIADLESHSINFGRQDELDKGKNQYIWQAIYARYAFWDISAKSKDDLVFSKALLGFGDIMAWANLCSHKWEYEDDGTEKLVWKPKSPVTIPFGDVLQVSIYPLLSKEQKDRFDGVIKINQQVRIEFSYQQPVPWETILDDVLSIQYFIALGMSERVELESISVCHSSNYLKFDDERDKQEKVILPSKVILGYRNTAITPSTMPFHYLYSLHDAINNSALLIWPTLYHKLKPVLDLYFSAIYDKAGNVVTLFLSLTQALETYHSRFYANSGDAYRQRIKSILDGIYKDESPNRKQWEDFLVYGRQKKSKDVFLRSRIADLIYAEGSFIIWPTGSFLGGGVQKVVDTRNYYTHYESVKEKLAFSEAELTLVNSHLMAILEYHLMITLGFDKEESVKKCKLNIKSSNDSYQFLEKTIKGE